MRLDDLLKANGIPIVNVPTIGRYIMGLGGGWRHSCTVDLPFQENVDLIFDLDVRSQELPESMPRNVVWIGERLTEIWNAGAFAINNITEAQQIESPGDFMLDDLHIELPDAPIETADWKLTVDPSYVQGSFTLTFRGLSVMNVEFISA